MSTDFYGFRLLVDLNYNKWAASWGWTVTPPNVVYVTEPHVLYITKLDHNFIHVQWYTQ